jgi:signal transduction histidine kinase
MSKHYLIDMLKSIGQGALISLSFGTYQQQSNNKIMQLNNEKQELQQKYFMNKVEAQYEKQINELKHKIDKMEEKSRKWD